MDGTLPSGISVRHVLELDECNMYYSVVKICKQDHCYGVYLPLGIKQNEGSVTRNRVQSTKRNDKGEKRPFPFDKLSVLISICIYVYFLK